MDTMLRVGLLLLGLSLARAAEDDYDLPDYNDHPCIRKCEDKGLARICRYTWVLENYYVLTKACFACPFNQSDCFRPQCVTADGVQRGIKTANRILPGPTIQVCERDTVEVTVDNRMDVSESTSIHWHGILQNGSQYMDGVAHVTQCPISPHSRFTYTFKAFDPGTHFWHSHAGVQRADGLFGSLVVRQSPSEEPHDHLYDFDLPEHVILINDWFVDTTASKFAAFNHDNGDNKPGQMLINGRGHFQEFKDASGGSSYTPRAKFTVKAGKRYRFRVISSGIFSCPVQVSIDNHTLTMIASDASPFKPFVVDSFNIFTGERYDFIFYADKVDTPRNYWFRARGLDGCELKKAVQTAILQYEGAPDTTPAGSPSWDDSIRGGILLNPWNAKATEELVPVSTMLSTYPDDDTMTSVPDKKYYLAIDFNLINNNRFNNPTLYPMNLTKPYFTPQINHISSQLPPSPPLTQYDDVSEDLYCNAENVQLRCEQVWCTCVHRYQVALGDLVELVVVDEGRFNTDHPMHLHGYKFRLVGEAKLGDSVSLDTIKVMDQRGELTRATSKAPFKDTVAVLDGGYAILRFRANNPGVWLFHCHIELHIEIGMFLIIQVGTKDQFPKRPMDFPTCGNWKFQGSEDRNSANKLFSPFVAAAVVLLMCAMSTM